MIKSRKSNIINQSNLQPAELVKMFCILPCPTIQDQVALVPIGETAKIVPQMNQTRSLLRKLSNTEQLIEMIRNGQVIMMHKVNIDNYLKAHVDLMRSYVSTLTACNFAYGSFFTSNGINTTGMSIKEQWAFEIVMIRFNVCSIYHAGAFNAMGSLFSETANTFKPDYKGMADFNKNVQIAFQYFSEGFAPLKRLVEVFDSVEALVSPQSKGKYPEVNKGVFEIFTEIVQCNLAYLKIQKFRILREHKLCKQGAYAVYLRVVDLKLKFKNYKSKYQFVQDMSDFLDLAEIFYQIYAFYFLLIQHEDSKNKEDYGFVKKEFQQMIIDNLIVIDQIFKLEASLKSFPNGDSLDNVLFARMIVAFISSEANKFKYRYNINIHETKVETPPIKEVIARRIGVRNIWNSLNTF